MKKLSSHSKAILLDIAAKGCVLMLDFDGTLAPIVKDFKKASMPLKTRKFLRDISDRAPVVVISGRRLADVRSRVGIKKVHCVGSHGLETENARAKHLPAQTRDAFAKAKRATRAVARAYRSVRIEDKGLSFALHYRLLAVKRAARFVEEATRAIRSYKNKLRVINDERAFDIMPKTRETKGVAARKIFKKLRRGRAIPVYIGDSKTDEDAYRALRGGITIRVGKSATSRALFYLPSQESVALFLSKILKTLRRRP